MNFEVTESSGVRALPRERAEAATMERSHAVIAALDSSTMRQVWERLGRDLAKDASRETELCTAAVKRLEPVLIEAFGGSPESRMEPGDLVSIGSYILSDGALPDSRYLRYRVYMCASLAHAARGIESPEWKGLFSRIFEDERGLSTMFYLKDLAERDPGNAATFRAGFQEAKDSLSSVRLLKERIFRERADDPVAGALRDSRPSRLEALLSELAENVGNGLVMVPFR